jgi:hypothetical protein
MTMFNSYVSLPEGNDFNAFGVKVHLVFIWWTGREPVEPGKPWAFQGSATCLLETRAGNIRESSCALTAAWVVMGGLQKKTCWGKPEP